MGCEHRNCGTCQAPGVMTILDSATASFKATLTTDLDEVVSIETSGVAPSGSPVQIECGDLTVLGEILSADGAVAQVRVEHILNRAAFAAGYRAAAAAAGRRL